MTAKVVDVARQFAAASVHTTQGGYWKNITASGVVFGGPCILIGWYVNNTTAGTLILFDNATTNTGPTGGLITPAIGFQWYPAVLQNGLFVTVGGAIDATFFYQG